MSFAAIIVTSAAEVQFWDTGPAIDGTVMFLIVPIVLVCINTFEVRVRSNCSALQGQENTNGPA